jgi:ferredoxin-thioredoxin reductase catalytic chain
MEEIKKEEKAKNLKKLLLEYAENSGFVLNPDERAVETIIGGLLRNEDKHGAHYCPCRLPSGNKEKDKEIICPCIYHKDEIKKDGHCKCRLFYKKSY